MQKFWFKNRILITNFNYDETLTFANYCRLNKRTDLIARVLSPRVW